MKTTYELPNYPLCERVICPPMTEKDWEEYFSLRDKLDVEMSDEEISSKLKEINKLYLKDQDELAGKLVASLPIDADLAYAFKCAGGYKAIQEFNLSQAKKKYPKEFGVKADSNSNKGDKTIDDKDRLNKTEVDTLCRLQVQIINLIQSDVFNFDTTDYLYLKLSKFIKEKASENNLIKIMQVELFLLATSYKTESVYESRKSCITTNMKFLQKCNLLISIITFIDYYKTYENYEISISGAVLPQNTQNHNGMPSDSLIYSLKSYISQLNHMIGAFSFTLGARGIVDLESARSIAMNRAKYLYQQRQVSLMDEYVTNNPERLISIIYSNKREQIIKNIEKRLKALV